MAHKTLISGTAYSVTGGRELIGGTGYGCKAGKTIIGGTAFTVPFAKGVPLSTISPGAILMLNESGSPAQFCVAKHDYESELNGAGLTLIVKKSSYGSETAFGTSANSYASSTINKRLTTYASTVIDKRIRNEIRSTKIPITKGNGNAETTTMDTKCFILSVTELGFKHNAAYFNEEGTALPNATELRVIGQWTRTASIRNMPGMGVDNIYAFYILSKTKASIVSYDSKHSIVPAFTLPGTTAVIANADGTYSLVS